MLLKNGLVHTGSGKTLANCDILVTNGVITAVGKGLDPGAEEVRDLTGLEVFPGFIDASDFIGCIDMAFTQHDYSETSSPVTPYLNIMHSIDPDEIVRQELWKGGVTTIVVSPGNQNVLGGTCCAVKSRGVNVNRMTMRQNIALKGSVTKDVIDAFNQRKAAPRTRMAMIEMLRAAFEDLPEGGDYRSRKTRGILEAVLSKKIPLVVAAESAAEIESVTEALKGLDIRLAFVLAYQAGRAKEALQKSGAAVILGELTRDAISQKHDICCEDLAALSKSGTKLCVSLMNGNGAWGRECMLWTAAKLMKAGAGEDELLKMLTVNPASLFGIDDLVGTLEAGKEADILVYDKNPLTDCAAKLRETFIRGESVYRE